MKKDNLYDLIIVGAGASGMYAGVHANSNYKTLILERNKESLRKFLMTGAGHCNVTNNVDLKTLNDNMLYSSKFMYSSFSKYGPKQIMDFCYANRVDLRQEENSTKIKIVCKNMRYKMKLDNLLAQNHNASIKYEVLVKKINYLGDEKIYEIIDFNGEIYYAKNLIIATGGLSYPKTGSTGDAYIFAKNLNINVSKTYPMGLGIIIDTKNTKNDDGSFIKELIGTPFDKVYGSVYSVSSKKQLVKEKGELMITHYGVGGKLIRRLSGYVSYHSEEQLELHLGFLDEATFLNEIKSHKLLGSCFSCLPNKFINYVLNHLCLSKNQETANLSKEQKQKLYEFLCNLKLKIKSTIEPNLAISTGGGIDIKELNPATMESKKYPNLYFIGECVGVSPKTGGFNMTVCFATALAAINDINNKNKNVL